MQLFIFFLFFHYMFRLHAAIFRWLFPLYTVLLRGEDYLILNVHKPSDPECYTPSSKFFVIFLKMFTSVVHYVYIYSSVRLVTMYRIKKWRQRTCRHSCKCLHSFSMGWRTSVAAQPWGRDCTHRWLRRSARVEESLCPLQRFGYPLGVICNAVHKLVL
jgi:hypothetical protein